MNTRDNSIDILRGIAIFTMIAANMAAHSLVEPHSFLFRLYGSLAAPLFIFLSGMMVSYTIATKMYKLNYYLKRCFATLVVAALIDIFLWGIFPFVTFDVLYIIALAMPIIYFYTKLNIWLQLLCIGIIFGLSPYLQSKFGYTDYPTELMIADFNGIEALKEIPFLKQFFIDGWFPVFPWLGVSLTGAFIGSLKQKTSKEIINKYILVSGFILLIIGVIAWVISQPNLFTRQGYSELFYPPTLAYIVTFIGLIFVLKTLIYFLKENKLMLLFAVYGKSSLLVYILHTVFIVFVFYKFDSFTFLPFLLLYLAHAIVLWCICYLVQKYKKDKVFPFAINFILGS